jgi:hypothetical protein
MIDVDALKEISRIAGVNTHSGPKTPDNHLPMQYLKVYGAKAYAILTTIIDNLSGLKQLEGRAALKFFPPEGFVPGRHATDEYMIEAWKTYAKRAAESWNSRRLHPLSQDKLNEISEVWVEHRIRKARRYVGTPNPKRLLTRGLH